MRILIKSFCLLILCVTFLLNANYAFAQTSTSSFASVVNPIRGEDFWDLKDQNVETVVLGQREILKQLNLPATWLIRFDALDNQQIINDLNNSSDEKGLFLEITPTWTEKAGVKYHKSENWHAAGSAFLTGYQQDERIKLIDTAFEEFKKTFSFYPISVGAWWIDSFSLDYMQKKYGITSALIVADQYTTDNYQIWGQYFSTSYYPAKRNALHPAQTLEDKLPVVISQWAARDPLNGYGNGVFESTFSVQPNDYIDYHDLDINYFEKLVDIYTKQPLNKFGSLVIGLENTYDWSKYKDEYQKQIEVLKRKDRSGELRVVSLKDFAVWYKQTFPNLSPDHIVVAEDPLGSEKKAVWFMNSYYRAGWFFNENGSVIRDLRQYVGGSEEICFQKRCDAVNFATFATRVLDEVTYGHKWVIDEGKITDFKISRVGEKSVLSYKNEAGNERKIDFLLRDIGIDGKTLSIDSRIFEAVEHQVAEDKKRVDLTKGEIDYSLASIAFKILKFLLFFMIGVLIPGMVLTYKLPNETPQVFKRLFLASVVGIVYLTVLFYISSLLHLRFLVYLYMGICLVFFLKYKLINLLKFNVWEIKHPLNLLSLLVIVAGVILQIVPVFKSGLVFGYGMGFWGPNTHDGVWHVALINQLIERLPVENPIFADTILKNYHFFYDLLVASTAYITNIDVLDLVFRFYPIVFSLLLGVGTYYLAVNLFKSKLAAIFSLYFVYFAGSFGWIIEYLKYKRLGGESAFWANQSVSFNLNPPFAVSLLIVIAFIHLLISNRLKGLNSIFIAVLLLGSLVGFKAYGAVLLFGALLLITIIKLFKKDFSYLSVFILSAIFSALIFLSNFQASQQLMLFAPFWFIHSMVDSPDRVGWPRLTQARIAGLETNSWFKFISAELISFVIFIFGNLGVRFLALFSIIKVKKITQDSNYLFILIFTVLSFMIPILFIQAGNPWNTIQFLYYGLYITALTGGAVLSFIVLKLPKFLGFLIAAVVIIFTPINSLTTASYYIHQPHAVVTPQELQGLRFLSNQENGTVLTAPYDKRLKQRLVEPWPLHVYDSTSYIAALSKKASYLEDEPQNQILLTDYKKRLVATKDFFARQNKEFLLENNIKYIYLQNIFNINLNEQNLGLEKIFENEEVLIYKVKQ